MLSVAAASSRHRGLTADGVGQQLSIRIQPGVGHAHCAALGAGELLIVIDGTLGGEALEQQRLEERVVALVAQVTCRTPDIRLRRRHRQFGRERPFLTQLAQPLLHALWHEVGRVP